MGIIPGYKNNYGFFWEPLFVLLNENNGTQTPYL